MFFFNKTKDSGVTWLVVGLGNIGDQYRRTRHNVGFQVIDKLSEDLHTPVRRLKFKAYTASVTLGGQKVLLMKPTTYMNLSGQAVYEAASFHRVPPEHILVISDEVALPPGALRIRPSGSAGGHNGLKNIIYLLNSADFPRIRLGVGQKPHPDYSMSDWVLGVPKGADREAIDAAVDRAAQAVEWVIRAGPQEAMSRFNSR